MHFTCYREWKEVQKVTASLNTGNAEGKRKLISTIHCHPNALRPKKVFFCIKLKNVTLIIFVFHISIYQSKVGDCLIRTELIVVNTEQYHRHRGKLVSVLYNRPLMTLLGDVLKAFLSILNKIFVLPTENSLI